MERASRAKETLSVAFSVSHLTSTRPPCTHTHPTHTIPPLGQTPVSDRWCPSPGHLTPPSLSMCTATPTIFPLLQLPQSRAPGTAWAGCGEPLPCSLLSPGLSVSLVLAYLLRSPHSSQNTLFNRCSLMPFQLPFQHGSLMCASQAHTSLKASVISPESLQFAYNVFIFVYFSLAKEGGLTSP